MSESLGKFNIGKDEIQLRDWYVCLPDRLLSFLSPFKLEITDSTRSEVRCLFYSMDYIDQIKEHTSLQLLDVHQQPLDIDAHFIDYLQYPEASLHTEIPVCVKNTLEEFKTQLYTKDIHTNYVDIYNQVILLEQQLATTLSNDEYVSKTKEVGGLYADFFTTLLSDVLDDKTKRFILEFFVCATLADNYEDLDKDHLEGRIKIKKNLLLKTKFMVELSQQLITCIKLYPDKSRILQSAVKYITAIVKGVKY